MKQPDPSIHIFQEADSNTCGPCCLAMVYAMRGKSTSLNDILNDFQQGPKGATTYVPQLATHLLTHGLDTNLTISSGRILSYAWKDLSTTALTDKLEAWVKAHPDDSFNANNTFLLEYLRKHGTVTIDSYNVNSFKKMLDTGSILILCVDESWLWGQRLNRSKQLIAFDDIQGIVEGHFVVLTSYVDNQFHVLDPYPTNLDGKHGIYEVDEQILLNASLTWAPQFIEVLASK